ncbi:hypothetical protein E2C01_044229 [Portunus trituberculatus]|uniref:Uncharacterized protein n=1 Tax=Portunus trituberculatus TaxID=210409 RepID=A0A5B7FSK4_PORTR|nr:hypothetical protein [Portunus trituberculatus]
MPHKGSPQCDFIWVFAYPIASGLASGHHESSLTRERVRDSDMRRETIRSRAAVEVTAIISIKFEHCALDGDLAVVTHRLPGLCIPPSKVLLVPVAVAEGLWCSAGKLSGGGRGVRHKLQRQLATSFSRVHATQLHTSCYHSYKKEEIFNLFSGCHFFLATAIDYAVFVYCTMGLKFPGLKLSVVIALNVIHILFY